MTESTQLFISELIRAANEVEKLTKLEQANLLRRAAATVREYREQIHDTDTPTNDHGQGDIVHSFDVMAETIDFIMPEQVAAALLEAADTIKAGRILLEAKHAFEGSG